MESLRRKLNNRAEMQLTAAAVRRAQALGRTTQAAHSTLPIGEVDVPLVDAAGTAVAVGEELPLVAEETELAGDEAWDAWKTADDVRGELADARVEIDGKLTDADERIETNRTELVAARERIDETFEVANSALDHADTALTMAGSKSKVLYSTSEASGTATVNDLWRRLPTEAEISAGASAGDIMQEWRYTANGWVETKISSTAIANLDVGKLTVGTGVISDLVAQHLAARTGEFMELGVDKLTAADAAMSQAVIEKLWADVVKAKFLTVTEKIIANDIFAAGVVSATALATDALDAMTVRSMQIYGGYIEAPTIASSAKLGGGVNLLNDPRFEGAVGTAWVASGHLGDAAAKQTDTITWDQPWNWYDNSTTPVRWVNSGRATADLNLTPRARATGTITFANYSWLNSTARQIDNPYTFRALYTSSFEDQYGGSIDPTFLQVDFPALKAATARTTYLTNSAVVAVRSGERFNVRLAASRVEQSSLDLITTAEIQIINASTSAVLWTRKILSEELVNGNVNAFWDCTYTGNVRYRIRATYTAAGEKMTRAYSPSSWARQTRAGETFSTWDGTQESGAIYRGYPRKDSAVYFSNNPLGAQYWRRANFDWRITSASFGRVEGGPGWRLGETTGFEIFNTIGERTVLLNGEDNYFTGRIASRDTGARWEIVGDKMSLFDGANTEIANIRRDGIYMRFGGSIRADGDVPWGRLDTVVPGAILGPGITHGVNSLYVGLQARIQDGVLYITGRLERSGGIPANHVLFSLPPGFRSPVPDPSYVYSGGDNFAVLQPNGECILALAATSYATITKMVIPLRN